MGILTTNDFCTFIPARNLRSLLPKSRSWLSGWRGCTGAAHAEAMRAPVSLFGCTPRPQTGLRGRRCSHSSVGRAPAPHHSRGFTQKEKPSAGPVYGAGGGEAPTPLHGLLGPHREGPSAASAAGGPRGRAERGERQRVEPRGRSCHPAQRHPLLQPQPSTPPPRETPHPVPAAPHPTPQGTSRPSVLPFPSLPFGKSRTRFPPQRGTFLKGPTHRGAALSCGPALVSSRMAKPPAPPAARGAALLPQPHRCCAPASETSPGPRRCLPRCSQP